MLSASNVSSEQDEEASSSPTPELWELFQEPPKKLAGLQWVECTAAQERFRVLTSSPDVKLVGADSQSDYTGTCVWPGGTAAAEYLHRVILGMRTRDASATPKVLELGAGTGLPGAMPPRKQRRTT
jgi:hypothetical protein